MDEGAGVLGENLKDAPFHNEEPVMPRKQRQQRRYRTGRNIQLNTKVTPDTRKQLYEISDRYNWVLGETLERALQALRRELDMQEQSTSRQ